MTPISRRKAMYRASYHHRLIILLLFLRCFDRGSTTRAVAATPSGRRIPIIHRFQREFRKQQRLSDLWVKEDSENRWTRHPCPCSNPDHCNPIIHYLHVVSDDDDDNKAINNNATVLLPPVRASRGEIYGFAGGINDTGRNYNWTHVSTVAWASNDELMCRAHEHGSRAVVASPSYNLTFLSRLDRVSRAAHIQSWVNNTLAMVRSRHRDGVVFDYESPVRRNGPVGRAYVELINATRNAFHHSPSPSQPPLQVTTCVAWSPNGIDGRYYDHVALAEASDLLYVMDYDTQSQITRGPCIASANAPISGTRQGIESFLELGIDSQKLVLGVPWYGYQYPCVQGTMRDPSDRFCPIPLVPFRGVDCSDAAGREVSYSDLIKEYKNQTPNELLQTGGMRRDEYMEASFFNLILNNSSSSSSNNNNETTLLIQQSWMDDPRSLRHKFSYARSVKLAGVGPYAFPDLDAVSQPEESKQMWSSFDSFFEKEETNNVPELTKES